MHTLVPSVGLFLAAMAAGVINSIAGGGSLVSFPALVAFGQPTLLANATNTSAMWPGTLAGALTSRRQTARYASLLLALLLPTMAGCCWERSCS